MWRGQMSARVFISYRRDDARWPARQVFDAFVKVLPRDHVFMDIDSIPLGSDFPKVLKGWVDQSDILLALIGSGWLDATNPRTNQRRLDDPHDFVRLELCEALSRGIPVVPVLLDGVAMPMPEQLPDDIKQLSRRQAEFVEYRTFEADVQRMIGKLQLDASREPEKPKPVLPPINTAPAKFVGSTKLGPKSEWKLPLAILAIGVMGASWALWEGGSNTTAAPQSYNSNTIQGQFEIQLRHDQEIESKRQLIHSLNRAEDLRVIFQNYPELRSDVNIQLSTLGFSASMFNGQAVVYNKEPITDPELLKKLNGN